LRAIELTVTQWAREVWPNKCTTLLGQDVLTGRELFEVWCRAIAASRSCPLPMGAIRALASAVGALGWTWPAPRKFVTKHGFVIDLTRIAPDLVLQLVRGTLGQAQLARFANGLAARRDRLGQEGVTKHAYSFLSRCPT
jgi:hypothetical protein